MNHQLSSGLAVLVLALTGLAITTTLRASTSSTTRADSYPVTCVSRTVPGDPRPYQVCVYNPL